jgi:hypothetical protein
MFWSPLRFLFFFFFGEDGGLGILVLSPRTCGSSTAIRDAFLSSISAFVGKGAEVLERLNKNK